MSIGLVAHTAIDINTKYTSTQILQHFGVPISDEKILCLFHKETLPSMQVNRNYVYCYGCKKSADNVALAQHLLSEKLGREVFFSETLAFFDQANLTVQSKIGRAHV